MQRNHAVGEKVVAGASITGESWGGVTNPPVKNIKRRVITSSNPSCTSALFPSFVLPRLMAGFAWTRNCVELPLLLASRDVVCSNEAAGAKIAASYAGDDGMVDDKRRSGERISIGWTSPLEFAN